MNNLDITTLDIKELKALAYDQIGIIEQTQQNLKAINNEISLRLNQEPRTSIDSKEETSTDSIKEETKE